MSLKIIISQQLARIMMTRQLKELKRLAKIEMIKLGYVVFEPADGDAPAHLFGIGPTNILMIRVQSYGRSTKEAATQLGKFAKPPGCILQVWEKVRDKGWVKTTI